MYVCDVWLQHVDFNVDRLYNLTISFLPTLLMCPRTYILHMHVHITRSNDADVKSEYVFKVLLTYGPAGLFGRAWYIWKYLLIRQE